MNTYAMTILGCKVNDFEAAYIRQEMNKHFIEVDYKAKADIYLIFTCCVTNTAEAKTRKFIHQARRNNPNGYIVAIGCLSQIKGNTSDFDCVDLIIGSSKKDKVVDMILQNINGNEVEKIIPNTFEELYLDTYEGKSRAFLKIQDGCNQFCNYCIIPYTRGRERCSNHNIVIENAKKLSKKYSEIVLTGIHTGRYYDGEYNLYKLLLELCKIDNINTIRLSSIEITEISDEIINLIKTSDKIAHHLHIPVQACSNEILKSMNRPYTIEEYIDRINYIRNSIPDISISTDLIVGFPGETDQIFKNSLVNIAKIDFSFIHCFPYSRKKNTVADKMDNHIDESIKKQRVSAILEISSKLKTKYINNFINKEVKVLIEKNDESSSYGYTTNYIYVKINGVYPVGSIINCIIISNDKEVIANASI